jgi:ADP-heptose:LPS heptosyltransferase
MAVDPPEADGGAVDRDVARPDQREIVVVLRALGLGDLCASVPALRAVVAARPESRVILAAPRALAPLLPLVHERLEHADAAALEPLPAVVHGAALAVNLHGRGPQSTQLLEATGPRDLVAYGVPRDGVTSMWREDEHERDRWCRLLVEHAITADPRDLHLQRPRTSPVPDGVTIVHPGASSRVKRWPLRRWVRVAAALRARGHQLLVTGDEHERGAALALGAAIGLREEQVTAGRTNLGDLAAIVSASRLIVSGDTGIAHLAFAYRRPSVTLYGPVSPSLWGPPEDGPHEVLCAGTRVRRIAVGDVLDACTRALDRVVAPPAR